MNVVKRPSLHILLVADQMDIRGGIPRTAADIANAMCMRGHTVTLLSDVRVQAPAYSLDERVHMEYYTFTDKNLEIQKLRERLKTMAPDVCVAMFCGAPHLVWAVTLLGTGIPFVFSEHCDPDSVEGWWTPAGRRASMSGADIIHLLLPHYADSVPDFLLERVRIIPNALVFPSATADVCGAGRTRLKLLWLGRLDDALKQCCLAMDAFALLADRFPQWDMHIVGDGKDRGHILRHHAILGLGGRVVLHGNDPNVWPHYLDAQLFCMSSRTEGFGLTTAEALGCGLPVVGFAACPGTAYLVRHGINGLLASEMTSFALAHELACLMQSSDLRQRMGEQALRIRLQESPDTIHAQWETLCWEAATNKGRTVMDGFAQEPFASMARLSAAARREYLYRNFGMPMPTY